MKVPNTINGSLSAEQIADINTKLDEIMAAMPFLMDLSPDERRTLPKMGDKSRAFVDRCLQIALEDDSFLPRNLNPEDFRRDVDLYNALEAIRARLSKLTELVDDSQLNAGSEAYVAALEVYAAAKRSGYGSGIDELADEVSRRFLRRRVVEDAPESVRSAAAS